LTKRHIPEAKAALLKATQAPLDKTQAKTLLEFLNQRLPTAPAEKPSSSE